MPIETNNLRIVISPKRRMAMVLLKRELYLSDIVSDVVRELSRADFNGDVVFEMLLTKGVSEHYYNMSFKNRAFDLRSNRVVHTPTNAVIAMSKRYYRSHPELLGRTSLTVRQVHYIREWVEAMDD